MSNHSTALVQKLWNYPDFIGACCHILRDNGLLYGNCAEQERIAAKVEWRLSWVELRGRHARLRGLSALVTANFGKESRDSVLQRATRLRPTTLRRAFDGKLVAQAQ